MTIGEKIKAVRIKKGLTQKQLGERCGMADSAIRRYELGGALPKIGTLRRIASALEVPLYEISDWSQYSAEDLRNDFVEGASELTRSVQGMVDGLIDGGDTLSRSATEDRDRLLGDTPRTRQEAAKWKEETLLKQFHQLNDDGQTAAVEAVENLTYNPKYTKEKN